MKRAHLSICPTCARHVRVDEPECPFCQGVLTDAFRNARPRFIPPRAGRAALYAAGAGTLAVAVAVGACSSSGGSASDPSDPMPVVEYGGVVIFDDAGDASDSAPPLPVVEYGAVVIMDGGDDDASPLPVVEYGGMVIFDGGDDAEADASRDASTD